ncbi:hypothetical protein EV652_116109 [Kribbella steppae]|uniref:Sodium:proton antiporter n=1 Tax=Kribbella steppae TaxID=2512223 RepID=A0A4R2H0S8_9ACTN|nr:DUF6328 family protein [Kribbella steppae]TCO18081.1 hypothetical protein EV652_116109 [Kribbella steppae]
MTGPEARYDREGENEAKRLDRQWNELLQELRLAQTGTQILFAFLLTIAFQATFQAADAFTHDVYAVTLIASALAVGLFLAPVSFHRLVYRQKLRDRMLPIAGHMTSAGLVFLVIAISGGVLLALDVVLSRTVAIIIVAIILVWFTVFWYVIPAWVRANANGE